MRRWHRRAAPPTNPRRFSGVHVAAERAVLDLFLEGRAVILCDSDLFDSQGHRPSRKATEAPAVADHRPAALPVPAAGEGAFEIESGPSGFIIRISPRMLVAAGNEATARKDDSNAPTPARTAMVALTVFDIMDSVDAASMLRDDLRSATLLDAKSATVDGKPSTVLRVEVKPSFATKSRFVSEPKIELKVWLGGDGIPLAAERVSMYSAGIGFVKGENTRSERWDFAAWGDRIYATRNEQHEDATAVHRTFTAAGPYKAHETFGRRRNLVARDCPASVCVIDG